jgi:hypothetical protein
MFKALGIFAIIFVLLSGLVHKDFETKTVMHYENLGMNVIVVDRGMVDYKTSYYVIQHMGTDVKFHVNYSLIRTTLEVIGNG